MPDQVALPRQPRPRSDLAVLQIDNEVLVYDDRTADLHQLNRTAALVFLLCDGKSDVDELVTEVASICSVAPGTVRSGVNDVLGELHAKGVFEL